MNKKQIMSFDDLTIDHILGRNEKGYFISKDLYLFLINQEKLIHYPDVQDNILVFCVGDKENGKASKNGIFINYPYSPHFFWLRNKPVSSLSSDKIFSNFKSFLINKNTRLKNNCGGCVND